MPRLDDHMKPRLYVVATSHLDSQWRWTIRTTIRNFLKATLEDNFERLESFPNFNLSFEGSFRYRLAKEYYPSQFERLRGHVAAGRWHLAGSMIDAPDTNIPAPESLIRHIVYGNGYFEAEFGRRSQDVFLPDCFGFPWSLPSIAAHCGLTGFSSQKLIKWRAPAELPFDIGMWEGPDGASVVAVLDPGGYGEPLREDLSNSKHWLDRIEKQRQRTGLAIGYKYFGVGDRGGAPDATTLDWLERSVEGDGAIEVIPSASDQLFRDLTEPERARLPVHRGELLLPTHGTGCWTSQAVLKKWNKNCEQLAAATERAALAANWLGQAPYPAAEIRREWERFLWHQMHDDLTGTSSPEAYRLSWNDLVLAQNRLSEILTSSVEALARNLETASDGVPLVIFNPLPFEREDLIDAWVRFETEPPPAVRVLAASGEELPCQELARQGRRLRILFQGHVPSVGFTVFEVLPADAFSPADDDLSVSETHLENWKYRAEIDESGAIASLFDKTLASELLARPADLTLLPDLSDRWPAWEIRYRDLQASGSRIGGKAAVRVLETGPVRVALEICKGFGSTAIVQRLSLARGAAGARLEVAHQIDWHASGRLLKAAFPLALDGATATYDMGLGAIERGTNRKQQHEVPAHQWADLTGASRGVSILSRHKYGWDRPDPSTLRLTLLRSPKAFRRFAHQAMQDHGRHDFSYAWFSHDNGPLLTTPAAAAAFSHPLLAFQAKPHAGTSGRHVSLLSLGGAHAQLMALKRSESSKRWLVRLRESAGADETPVTLDIAGGIEAAWQVDGSEAGETLVSGNADKLDLRLPRFAPRSYLIAPRLASQPTEQAPAVALHLPFDTRATGVQSRPGADLDGRGRSIPAELFPSTVSAGGRVFPMGSSAVGARNAVACRGQTLALPAGDHDRLQFLAASSDRGGTKGVFSWIPGRSGNVSPQLQPSVKIPYYSGFVGQWKEFSSRFAFLLRRFRPGFIERTPVAWVASHRHNRMGRDEVYRLCYLFLFDLTIPPDTRALELPHQPAAKIFSAVVSRSDRDALYPASLLYD